MPRGNGEHAQYDIFASRPLFELTVYHILRILRILQIDIGYIAYFTDRHFGILRVLRILQIDLG